VSELRARWQATFGGLPGVYWTLWVGTLVNRLGAFVVPILGLYLTRGRGLPVEHAGLIVAIHGAGTVAAAFIGGVSTDRLGRRRTLLLALAGGSIAASSLSAQLADSKVLSHEAVRTMVQAATEHAQKNNWAVSIAVVDAHGELLAFRRLDNASLASIDISQGKARTAARLKRPTKALSDAIAGGATALLTVPGIIALQGGLPVMWGTVVIGGIGVSGVTSEQDEQIAQAGLSALKQ